MSDFIGGIRFARSVVLIFLGTVSAVSCKAQVAPASPAQSQAQSGESGTSADLFVMLGSDLDRPGWVPAANYNVGIGHTFAFLKKDPIGDEVTSPTHTRAAGRRFGIRRPTPIRRASGS